MANVAVATTDSFASKLSGASVDDVMVMAEHATNDHLTAGTGTSRESVNKRVVVRAASYDAATWEGKFVRDATGHLKSDYPARWRGGWQNFANGVIVRGMLFVGRMSSGGGSVHVLGNTVVFEDCGFTDDFGYIMSIIGESTQVTGVVFNRCRFWNIGSRADHDHPCYWKATGGSGATRCMAIDCIFYNSTGWAMHCYPNGSGVLYKRCLVYRCNGAGVFSAEGSLVTSGAGFENCLLVDAQGNEVTGPEGSAHPRYLVEINGSGSGYVTDTMAVNNDPGAVILGEIQSTPNIVQTNVLKTGVPLWVAGTNPMATGDFRLSPNPSNPALGYGPTYIQPAGALDTAATESVLALHAGASALEHAGRHTSLVITSTPPGGASVDFANDPDRVTP